MPLSPRLDVFLPWRPSCFDNRNTGKALAMALSWWRRWNQHEQRCPHWEQDLLDTQHKWTGWVCHVQIHSTRQFQACTHICILYHNIHLSNWTNSGKFQYTLQHTNNRYANIRKESLIFRRIVYRQNHLFPNLVCALLRLRNSGWQCHNSQQLLFWKPNSQSNTSF